MSKLSLDQLRSAFKQNNSNEGNSNLPNNYFPFFRMNIDEEAVVRFLPDANPENEMGFLVEKVMHNLHINGERKNVPCLSMFGEDCPICKVSQQFYKNNDEENGKKYWKKRQYIAQVLVRKDPLPANDAGETHEGKVRFVNLGFQIFSVIKETFESGELDEVPYAFEGGTDFVIKKSQQGQYPTYSVGSRFSRRSTDLTEDEKAYVEEQMVDLSTLLPKHPGRERVESMLEAALYGGTVDDQGSSSTPAPTVEAQQAQQTQQTSEPSPSQTAEPAPANDTSGDEGEADDEANEILAQIRARRQNQAQE